MNVAELIKTVNEITPFELAFEDDKVGLLIGTEENDVSGVLIAHDLENSILELVDNDNINTVITYHPAPMKEVLDDNGEYVDELSLIHISEPTRPERSGCWRGGGVKK